MATSDIVALQAASLVGVAVLLSVQEAVIVVVHSFGFSHAHGRRPSFPLPNDPSFLNLPRTWTADLHVMKVFGKLNLEKERFFFIFLYF